VRSPQERVPVILQEQRFVAFGTPTDTGLIGTITVLRPENKDETQTERVADQIASGLRAAGFTPSIFASKISEEQGLVIQISVDSADLSVQTEATMAMRDIVNELQGRGAIKRVFP